MKFTESPLKGAYLIEPTPFVDHRGTFARAFCAREFAEHGLATAWVQSNLSTSTAQYTLRGMHYQSDDAAEDKLVRCVRGRVLDVILDIRPTSPTFGKHYGVELTEKQGNALYVPRGFAHGFLSLEPECAVFYLVSNFYTTGKEHGIRYNDPFFAVPWPVSQPIVSDKDNAHADFHPPALREGEAPMNVLVSGAFGYIGMRLLESLRAGGHSVGALVRSVPAFAEPFARDHELEVIRADIGDPITSTPSRPYDALVHLAAANDVASRDPAAALRVTSFGTRNVAELCRRAAIPRLIYASTFQVYGTDSGSVDESTPVKPLNDYALTHLFAEQYALMAGRTNGPAAMIVRPANIFGAPSSTLQDRWSLVPSCFCKEAFESGTITLRSSGLQNRDFLGVGDIARMLACCVDRFDSCRGEVVNLTSGESSTVLSLADRVRTLYERLFGKPCELRVLAASPDASPPLIVSTEKRKRLGIVTERPDDLDVEIERTFYVLRNS